MDRYKRTKIYKPYGRKSPVKRQKADIVNKEPFKFSNIFLKEENVIKIHDWHVEGFIRVDFFFMTLAFLFATYAQLLTEFSIDTAGGLASLFFTCVMTFIGLFSAANFIYLSEKYNVFRKRWLAPFFVLLLLVIVAITIVLYLFAIKIDINQFSISFLRRANTNKFTYFYWFSFAFILYWTFCHASFMNAIYECALNERYYHNNYIR